MKRSTAPRFVALFLAALLATPLLSPGALAQNAAQAPVATPRIVMVNIWVSDLDRSARFYQQAFGLNPPQPYNPRERIFRFADPAGPFLELELTDKPRANSGFSMMVADVDAVVSRTVAAGGAVVRTPGSASTRNRIAQITDPDGVLIEVIQPVARQ